jgi:hypothetical protein
MSDFFDALRNLSAYLHNLQFNRFLVSMFRADFCRVYMSGLGWYEGKPGDVVARMVADAKRIGGVA